MPGVASLTVNHISINLRKIIWFHLKSHPVRVGDQYFSDQAADPYESIHFLPTL